MRSLELRMMSETVGADAAFELIQHFERYPELVDEVRSVEVRDSGDGPVTSDWEVYFRNGPLRWTEIDYIQLDQRRIVFEQTDGDFHVFRGTWLVTPAPRGCRVTFEATFDFGIPSLAGVLDPIATKVLKEGIALVISRLLGDAVVLDDPVVRSAVAAKLSVAALDTALSA